MDGMPDPEVAPKESFSTVFGKALVTEGEKNQDLCAITAAMKYGTGLQFLHTAIQHAFLMSVWQSSTLSPLQQALQVRECCR